MDVRPMPSLGALSSRGLHTGLHALLFPSPKLMIVFEQSALHLHVAFGPANDAAALSESKLWWNRLSTGGWGRLSGETSELRCKG